MHSTRMESTAAKDGSSLQRQGFICSPERSRKTMMKLGIVLWALPGFVPAVIGQPAHSRSAYPLTIDRIEARCVEALRTIVGETRSVPPQYVYATSGCLYRIEFQVHTAPHTTLGDSAFTMVGSLPDGKGYRRLVRRDDVVSSGTNLLSFTVDIKVRKGGWADFIIIPADSSDSGPKENLYNYSVRSNKRSVLLEAPGQSDINR